MDDATATSKIVIIEDDVSLAEIYQTRLGLLGYTCFSAPNGIAGLYFVQKEVPDLVLLDLMIPDIGGGSVLEIIRQSEWGADIKVLVISNLNENEAPANLRTLGIEGYAVKANMNNDDIDHMVEDILRPASASPVGS